MRYQVIIFHLILVVFLTNCASGQNPYFNNKNTLGLLGGAGGAAGGAILCKNCKGVAKVAAIGGGALLGLLAGSRAGEYFDRKDQDRQVKLIEDVLANNQDNQVSTTQYQKSFRNPKTGQTQNGIISQSAVPLRTYQQNNLYAQNNIQQSGIIPIPRNDDCEVGCRRPQTPLYPSNNSSYCRDLEITFSVSVDNAPPTKQQYYSYCKTEQGWKQVN
jgi:hypothetical protein